MNSKEEFERIRKRFEETENAGAYDEFDRYLFYKDMRTLIYIIDAMDKRQQQEKFKLNSLYGYKTTESINKEKNYKNVDIKLFFNKRKEFIYGDVDVEIDNNFIKISNEKQYISIFTTKDIQYIKIRPAGKIEELFESEVK